MTEAICLYVTYYDILENNSGSALEEKLIGVFVEDTTMRLTAHGVCARFLAGRPACQPYLGNDGKVYPIYRTKRITLNTEIK